MTRADLIDTDPITLTEASQIVLRGVVSVSALRSGPGSGVYDAGEGTVARAVANEDGSGEADPLRARDATLEALRSNRALYGNAVGSDFATLMAALCDYRLRQLGDGGSLPFGLSAAENQEAPDPGKDTAPAPGPHEAVAKD